MMYNELSLVELVNAVRGEMEVKKYSKQSLVIFEGTCRKLIEYANQLGITNYSAELGNSFLLEHYKIIITDKLSESQCTRVRIINKLNDYQQYGYLQVKQSRRKHVYPVGFSPAVINFIEHRKLIGICEATILEYGSHLEDFCSFLYNNNVSCIEEIDASLINKYLLTLSSYAKGTKATYARHIRLFLKYSYDNGLAKEDLSYLVPMIRYNKRPELPSTYTNEEIERLLSCIDRGNPKGKRDYAVILLVARLGMRAGDICKLCFDNINWEKEQIEFIQSKTSNPVILPLMKDVGEAIIDYLKYGRPNSESTTIFLKHIAPIQGFTSSTLHYLVTRYMQKAKISPPTGKRHGPHALRHPYVKQKLKNNFLFFYQGFPVKILNFPHYFNAFIGIYEYLFNKGISQSLCKHIFFFYRFCSLYNL